MPNQLQHETSPYLLQHADNPVDWYPWGEKALALAREHHKPVLLSIGYSACHWCHVMAHESFEDNETAALMNRLFINIKVDREERPDLDRIYQTAHHILAQRAGGWPLTLFLRPDNHMPFFAGTYFPGQSRGGMVSFKELMQHVHDWYQSNPDALAQQNDQLQNILEQLAADKPGDTLPDPAILHAVTKQLARSFDPVYGGFGQAPKFPHPTNIERLLRHGYREKDEKARHMANFTLEKMAMSGMNDQLGGGFCRYSVDERWEIPHFEKMLYDNGPLLALYAQACAADGSPLFKQTAQDTAQWVMREMQAPEGGYYSSLDADSQGEEGKFYVWTQEAIKQHLDEKSYQIFAMRYGLDRQPNFEGKWNLHIYSDTDDIARTLGISESQVDDALGLSRKKLFEVRKQRVPPRRDDKILTSWNALMIKGMAIAARYCQQPTWLQSAIRALDFIRQTLWSDRRLLATCKDNKAHLNAYLDDYACLIDATLEVLQNEWNSDYLQFACTLADQLLENFEDKQNGGFFFTANDHETLIQRPKPCVDDAMPAGNGIAAYALQRLGHLTGHTDYIDAAERCLKAASHTLKEQGYACMAMLLALEEHHKPVTTIIIRGHEENLHTWQSALAQNYRPDIMIYSIKNSETDSGLPDAIKSKHAKDMPVAWICRGMECSPPVTRLEDLLDTCQRS